jgi:hypothetical protein
VGVAITTNSTVATEGSGTLSITGCGRGSGDGNSGIEVFNALVQASSNGPLTLIGKGGTGRNRNVGIDIAFSSNVKTLGGNLSLTGTGKGSGTGDDGIVVEALALASAGGSGGVILNGSGAARSSTAGVRVTSGGHILAGLAVSSAKQGVNPALNLGLNFQSTIVAGISALNTTASGYEFVHVDGTVNIGGASLNATPLGTIIPGMGFTLINITPPVLVGGSFSSKLFGPGAYAVNLFGGDGNDVTLKRLS